MRPKQLEGTGLLSEVKTAQRVGYRDRLIDEAVKANKITASERKRYREMYDRDPVGTQQLLAKLAPGPPNPGQRPRRTGLLRELGGAQGASTWGVGVGQHCRRRRSALPMTDDRIAMRVARVGFLLDMARDRRAVALTPPDDLDLSAEERADLLLTNELLDIEFDHRRRQWAALERLLSLVPPGGSYEQIALLPDPQAVVGLSALYDCGWLDEAPKPDAG